MVPTSYGENPDPFFQRMVDEVMRKIANGELKTGDPIPSLRDLADEFGTALGTAVRAHAHLKSLGVVHQSPGRPTLVVEGARDRVARLVSDRYAARFRHYGAGLLELSDGSDRFDSVVAELRPPTRDALAQTIRSAAKRLSHMPGGRAVLAALIRELDERKPDGVDDDP